MIYKLMMTEDQKEDIINECVLLSIALLLGGNLVSQNAFYKEL